MEISRQEKYYISLLDKNKINTIFDIGCNKGFFTEYLLEVIGPENFYYLFDPSDRFYNVSVNKFKNNPKIKIHNLGLSDEIKIDVDFFELIDTNDDVEGMSSFIKRDVYSNYKYEQKKVSVINLDYFITLNKISNIDFIKIDTEGHELKILKGLTNNIQDNNVKMIQIEYGNCSIESGYNLYDILFFLNSTNYKLFIFDDFMKEINSENVDKFINLNWCNLLIKQNE